MLSGLLMNPDVSILELRHWPARLNVQQTADALGFEVHEIGILLKAGLLKKALLGRPALNGHRFFSANVISALGRSDAFLSKSTLEIQKHWVARNHQYKTAHDQRAPSKLDTR
jgi:hypothetical protein